MQYETKAATPIRRLHRSVVASKHSTQYSSRLTFYEKPPTDVLSLADSELLAIERLKALKIVENIGLTKIKNSDEYVNEMTAQLKTCKMVAWTTLSIAAEGAKMACHFKSDYISHYLLRLACCQSENNRRWFIQQESDLFRYRFERETTQSKMALLEEMGFPWPIIGNAEKESIVTFLVNSLANPKERSPEVVKLSTYFKVPWTEVLDLVARRQVFVQNGYAFVRVNEVTNLVASRFRASLSEGLSRLACVLPSLGEDERLVPLMESLHSRYLGNFNSEKFQNGGAISAEQIPHYQKHFPPCVSRLFGVLKNDHKLKHWGRLQLGLFFKGAGVPLDQALKFWRSEFTKVMKVDDFEKQYAYNIRHSYGKEGKQANYQPPHCMKIITQNPPGPSDVHGCPFKHSDISILKQNLSGLTPAQVDTIVTLKKANHFQVACSRYFEFTHGLPENSGPGINHPNEYFEESVRLSNNP